MGSTDQEKTELTNAASTVAQPGSSVQRSGPSTTLTILAAVALVAVALLSVLLARREASASSQTQANPAQFALNGALQAAGQLYLADHKTFPQGRSLTVKLQRTDSSLTFAFGPQSVVSADNTRLYNATGISVAVSSNGQVIMFAAPGSNRTCWYATENHQKTHTAAGLHGASRASGTTYAGAASQQSCTAGARLPLDVTLWGASWPTT